MSDDSEEKKVSGGGTVYHHGEVFGRIADKQLEYPFKLKGKGCSVDITNEGELVDKGAHVFNNLKGFSPVEILPLKGK